MSYFSPFNFMFSVIPVLVGLGFVLVFGLVFYSFIKGAKEWNQNNHSPRLTVAAVVVTKRVNVSHHSDMNHSNNTMNHSSSTYYYVTFQVESGDRMEFRVESQEYGMLVDGDVGKLTFQGTRYIGFERKYSNV